MRSVDCRAAGPWSRCGRRVVCAYVCGRAACVLDCVFPIVVVFSLSLSLSLCVLCARAACGCMLCVPWRAQRVGATHVGARPKGSARPRLLRARTRACINAQRLLRLWTQRCAPVHGAHHVIAAVWHCFAAAGRACCMPMAPPRVRRGAVAVVCAAPCHSLFFARRGRWERARGQCARVCVQGAWPGRFGVAVCCSAPSNGTPHFEWMCNTA